MDFARLREIMLSTEKEINEYSDRLLAIPGITSKQRALIDYERNKLINNITFILKSTE